MKKISLMSVLGFFMVGAAAFAADSIPSTVTLYRSTTWTNPYTFAVIRQPSHAEIYYCKTGNNYSGDPSNSALVLDFFSTYCKSPMTTGSYSNSDDTGFQTKVYLPVGSATPSRMLVSVSYANSKSALAVSAGFQTFIVDLDVSANVSTSTLAEQGASIQFQASDNPIMNSSKQTFVFAGSAALNTAVIRN